MFILFVEQWKLNGALAQILDVSNVIRIDKA